MTRIITIIFLAVIAWLLASAIGNAIAMMAIHAGKKIKRFIKHKMEVR